jgi:serine/threonine-protein kinase RIO1
MAYTEMVMIIRKLYQDCRLVHGDLSEYNILFHEVSIDGSTSGKSSHGCLPKILSQATSHILHMRKDFTDFAYSACAGYQARSTACFCCCICIAHVQC